MIGGVVSLWLSGQYLSVPASIGFIELFGLAVGNGIVLVSYVNQLRHEGIQRAWGLVGYVANLGGCANLILKATCGVILMMWVRWTLPRRRIDQVIAMCWKYCVPIVAVGFIGALTWRTCDWPTPNTIGRVEVRERWAVPPPGAPSTAAGVTGGHAALARDTRQPVATGAAVAFGDTPQASLLPSGGLK